MNLAGMPATMALSGTPLDTTSPAATKEFSPIVTPGKMVAAATESDVFARYLPKLVHFSYVFVVKK